MEYWAGKSEMGGLNHLGGPELEDRVDGKDNLEEGEGLSCRVIFKDMLTSNSEKRSILRSEWEKVGVIEGSVSEGGWDVGVLDGSEVPESLDVEGGVWGRRVWRGGITGSGRKGKISGVTHCGARSKEREGRDKCLLTQLSEDEITLHQMQRASPTRKSGAMRMTGIRLLRGG